MRRVKSFVPAAPALAESKCGIRSVMKEVRETVVKILEGVDVAELCERVKQLQGVQANPLDYVI